MLRNGWPESSETAGRNGAKYPPKGDHRHFRGVEEPYNYKDPETLIHDFFKDVELVLSGKDDS